MKVYFHRLVAGKLFTVGKYVWVMLLLEINIIRLYVLVGKVRIG
jgi:hypothetical protein